MANRALIVPLAVLVCCSASASATAQSCGDGIAQLERQYDLANAAAHNGAGTPTNAPAPPATIESRGVTATQPLAKPAGTPTATAVATPQSGASMPPEHLPPLSATERQSMVADLAEARAAERQGDSAQCLDRLHAAQQAAARPTRQP